MHDRLKTQRHKPEEKSARLAVPPRQDGVAVINEVRQFVPSGICLECDGCCRFHSRQTVWAPLDRDIVPYEDYFICSCFNPGTHECRNYPGRPFDCRIYPFLLHKNNGRVWLAADLKCPYLNSKIDTGVFGDYARYLQGLLNTKEAVELLKENPALIAEYDEELKIIAAISLKEKVQEKSLTLEDKPLLDKYLAKSTHQLSAFSFANIFVWRGLFDIRYRIIQDNLCVFFKDETGCFMYLPPLGDKLNRDIIEECFGIMDSHNPNSSVSRIENTEEDSLDFYKQCGFKIRAKDKEYLYETEDLIRLCGDKFKSKRASYNHFVKNYDYKLESLEPDYIGDCLEVLDVWKNERLSQNRDNVYVGILEDNFLAQKEALLNFSGLDLTGRVVKIEGRIKGWSLGFELSEDTFCILAEAADLKFNGIAQFLFREFARSLERYRYINVMDDSGLDNLRRVKLSYRPQKRISSYILERD